MSLVPALATAVFLLVAVAVGAYLVWVFVIWPRKYGSSQHAECLVSIARLERELEVGPYADPPKAWHSSFTVAQFQRFYEGHCVESGIVTPNEARYFIDRDGIGVYDR